VWLTSAVRLQIAHPLHSAYHYYSSFTISITDDDDDDLSTIDYQTPSASSIAPNHPPLEMVFLAPPPPRTHTMDPIPA